MLFMHVTGEHGCVALDFASLPRTGAESKILSTVSAALKTLLHQVVNFGTQFFWYL